jgi:hypothetical protein
MLVRSLEAVELRFKALYTAKGLRFYTCGRLENDNYRTRYKINAAITKTKDWLGISAQKAMYAIALHQSVWACLYLPGTCHRFRGIA